MRLPGQKRWSQSVYTGLVGPWSYGVKVGESTFVQNCRQRILSGEQTMPSPDLPQPQNNTSEKVALIRRGVTWMSDLLGEHALVLHAYMHAYIQIRHPCNPPSKNPGYRPVTDYH